MVEEKERAGWDGRGGERGDYRTEEGWREDVGRRGEEEGQGRTGGSREVRKESGEEGGVDEEAELGEESVKLVAGSGSGGTPAGEAAKETEDGGRSIRVGRRRRLHGLAGGLMGRRSIIRCTDFTSIIAFNV